MSDQPRAPLSSTVRDLKSAGSTPLTRMLFGICVLAVIYFGREILIPVTLAFLLSLAIAPAIRLLKRVGFGQVSAVLFAVAAVTLTLIGLATLIGLQAVDMADSMPQYQSTIRSKIQVVRQATVGHVESMQGSAGRIFGNLLEGASEPSEASGGVDDASRLPAGVVPVQIQERTATPVQLASHLVSSVWVPLRTAGVVLVVLIFVLLDYESLRDRFIRLTGGADLRTATYAFNDAGLRLSRFFVSQFLVNLGVGAVIGVGLSVIGVPHGVFWAVVTASLRFVPYVGVATAAIGAAALGAAVDPGWQTVWLTIALFAVVEVLVAQVVEPQLYGHSTGLSPLSVVLAALFWGWIWGPVGLLVSTPLTLCLVVAGHHVKSLSFLDVLLGDTSPLSLSERFYQRALSDDADEIVSDARKFLKTKSFAKYCDQILMPALELGAVDLATGSISTQQQKKIAQAIVKVVESLGTEAGTLHSRRRRVSVLDDPNIGLQLRRIREANYGKWQGPLEVPAGSVTLCLSVGSMRNDFVAEILVRVLREQGIDARNFSIEDFDSPMPHDAVAESVALIYVVISVLAADRDAGAAVYERVRKIFPSATVVGLLPYRSEGSDQEWASIGLDVMVDSFDKATKYAIARHTPERPTRKNEI